MALPSSVLRASEAWPQFGLVVVSLTAHFIWSAKPLSQGLYRPSWGSESSDWRGGSRVAVGVPKVHSFMFSGRDRYSIHSQAASLFLLWLVTTKLSPAMVVAQRAGPAGSGATLHLPLIFGNDWAISPPNQAPAMYMPTLPVAKATRPSQELEARKSGGEYLRSPT